MNKSINPSQGLEKHDFAFDRRTMSVLGDKLGITFDQGAIERGFQANNEGESSVNPQGSTKRH